MALLLGENLLSLEKWGDAFSRAANGNFWILQCFFKHAILFLSVLDSYFHNKASNKSSDWFLDMWGWKNVYNRISYITQENDYIQAWPSQTTKTILPTCKSRFLAPFFKPKFLELVHGMGILLWNRFKYSNEKSAIS